ncbi:SGNH/GDSL hydrolase family protein [Blastococcus saxobsidens]|uniref:SGNH/GDSL hydrolase family protein n=1 Tax=Blastococcus saxobsidens TaxID=138336 RepID=A0A6L9W783_9ACTN|nr:SGNH/GDSL hydrolase family protein [Blastococcus saxobsidens]
MFRTASRPLTIGRGAVLVAAVGTLLAGCAGGDGPGPGPAAPAAGAGADVRLAVIGDSITQADGDVPRGRIGPTSWLDTATGQGARFAGGWARAGATTEDMLAAATPVDADVLVILAGTNDPRAGISGEGTADNIRAVVDRVGVEQVVISAVPPRDPAPEIAVATNEVLAELADDEGWDFVDAMEDVREDDRYAPGMTDDGIHPTARAAALIGEALGEAVVAAAAD